MTLGRVFALAGALAILFAASYRMASGQLPVSEVPASANGAVVVAELFTSEGCSSCPPADEILTRLVQQQPFDGITVLGLSEHVDYWNRLGWVDPFSSAAFTRRQVDYQEEVFRTPLIYTPQIIVDGHLEQTGSRGDRVSQAIIQAAQLPKASVNVAAALGPDTDTGDLRIDIEVNVVVPPEVTVQGAANVVLAITEDHLGIDVLGGENRGRQLKHTGVVRKLLTIGELMPETPTWSTETSVPLAPQWKTENLKIIVFLQEQQSWRIVGAGWSKVESLAATR